MLFDCLPPNFDDDAENDDRNGSCNFSLSDVFRVCFHDADVLNGLSGVLLPGCLHDDGKEKPDVLNESPDGVAGSAVGLR